MRSKNSLPGDSAVDAARLLFGIGLFAIQVWTLQIGVEEGMAGRTESLAPLALLSIACFSVMNLLRAGNGDRRQEPRH